MKKSVITSRKKTARIKSGIETAIFAAGCFWHIEAEFRKVPGVIDTKVGYTGGHTSNPTYEDVCSNKTGHAEAVQVEYDSSKISYSELLDIFWQCHDPTSLNRQGPDVGSQYRSAIFYVNEVQRKEAELSRIALEKSGKLSRPIVTQILLARKFYFAEEYHQQYLEKSGIASCRI